MDRALGGTDPWGDGPVSGLFLYVANSLNVPHIGPFRKSKNTKKSNRSFFLNFARYGGWSSLKPARRIQCCGAIVTTWVR